MKLQRIRIEQFRKFAAPVEIDGLEPGLNLLYGPNESGKSTIAQALRTLFFERHNTKGDVFVQAISPAGMADAAPTIEADFTLGAKDCKLAKTFFQKPRASLTIGTERWDGNEADEQLAERLGFALSARGSSRAETHGIPGLLWIEQGASADLDTAVAHAAGSLEERLKSILGDIVSSAGSGLAAAIQNELAKLRTIKTNKPTGVLAEDMRTLDAARLRRDTLQASAEEYRALTDSLAHNLTALERLERDKPWEAYEQQRREAQARKDALEPEQRALKADRQSLREVNAHIDSLHEQNTRHDKDVRALVAQREALANAVHVHQQVTDTLKQAQQRHTAAREALRVARDAQRIAEQRQQREGLQAELVRITADIARMEAALSRAEEFGHAIAQLRTRAAAAMLSKADLSALAKLDQSVRETRIQRDAIATRIAYRLEPGRRIDAGTLGSLEGSGNEHLTSPLTLRIEGVGEIDIAPGGEDIARLSDALERVTGEFASRCAALGVKDLADAQARHTRWQEIEQEIALAVKERDTLLDARSEAQWREQLAEARGQHQEREQRLRELQPVETGLSLEAAQRMYEDADAAANAAGAYLETQRQAATQAALAEERLRSHVDAESRRLESDEARAAADTRSREWAEALARRDALEQKITEAATLLAERKPELMDADITRLAQALTTVAQQRRDLHSAIHAAEGKLEALGADGLDEKLARAKVEVENLERRVAQNALRADALSLLDASLAAHQDAATQRLYAPLRARLAQYLELLFPGVELGIGVDKLRPSALDRGGTELALEEHSHGTREQLGVIARFAYADLLKQAGQPTLLILDDALVHSDAGRREQMKRILHEAAQRHQILLFTCHPEEWRDAGARKMVDVAALGASLRR